MSQNEQVNITPGMQRYIDKNKKYLTTSPTPATQADQTTKGDG
jgi:hypothetical protein